MIINQLQPGSTMNPDELEACKDRAYECLSQTVPGRKEFVVAQAQNCTIKTADGRLYLDFNSGIAVANVGHSHPAVVAAVQKQIASYAHVNVFGRFVVPVQVEIAERLARVAPGELNVAFLTSTGTEAIEGALKLARKYTGRSRFVAFERGFHGRTFGSLSVSWRPEYRAPFEPLLQGVDFVPFDDLAAVEQVLGDETAAVIVEPIQGEGGVRVPSDDFLPGLRDLCTQSGALLITDEIQGAMGRAGRWFSFELWDVVPDIVAVAKSFGGGLPLGAFLSTPEIFSTFLDPPLSHLTTFGGNPVACAAAVAAFDVIESNGLLADAETKGAELKRRLELMKEHFPNLISDVRGRGLWLAIDLPPDLIMPIVKEMENRGVLVGSMLNSEGTMRISPPLIVTESEMDVFIGVLRASLLAAKSGTFLV